MEKIIDKEILYYYIEKYSINNIFSMDMIPFMELILFNKNQYICKAEESLDYVFFFVEGKAKVYSTLSNGKSLLLGFYHPFKVIGDLEFLNYNDANSNVQVIEDSYCIGITMENIRSLCQEDPIFLKYICSTLGEKLISLSKYSSINLLYPLENRLASYILAVVNTSEAAQGGSIIFQGNLAEMAELLGTSYRHLLRTLNVLCEKKAIKKADGCYEIVDMNKLQGLAGDLYE